ncbi:phospholipase D-like domain-containing protein [Marinitoga sp. 1155]|uniref:phospholipase D-like domain-containing protein n=1 Tax=Marinitoga sp. 1155 TaxID=1428448 RepID=UPI000641723C|nr:phospholipase D-like domain-containing protein [Marinitoga sp. 1155]KLO22268.1 hypothetical protein X274_08975 [Marinitoga sp. 1155]
MKKFFLILYLFFSLFLYSYRIFITPSYELADFIEEKIIISNNIKFVSLSLNAPFLSILNNKNNVEGFIEFNMYDIKSNNILPDKNTEGYLHEKFMIFDNKSVLFGTGNFTSGSIFEDLNVYIYTEDQAITSLFLKEFQNFQNGKFGKNKNIENKSIYSKDIGKIIFITGPSKNIYNSINNFILSSKKFLYIFTYSFTDGRILYSFEKLSSINVDVKIIADNWNEKFVSNLKYLKGIEYKILKKYRNMHLKLLVNEHGLLLGSYNLTYRAREKNDEYILIIYNKDIRQILFDLFNKLWNQ